MAWPEMIGAAILLSATFGCIGPNDADSYHAHADFRVVLDGKVFDFNKAEYMSTPYKELDGSVHMHDFNPYVIHFHGKDATLGEFFQSIGMELEENYFSDGTKKYFTDGTNSLTVYVNGKPIKNNRHYIPADLDRILVYYGKGAPSTREFASLTSWACVYSEKCPAPEGVVMPQESCTASKPCSIYDTG